MKKKLAMLLSISMTFSMFVMSFSSNAAIAANDKMTQTFANRLSEIKMEVEQELIRKETAFKEAEAKLEEATATLKKAQDNMRSKGSQFTEEDQGQVIEATLAVKPYQEAYNKAKAELDYVEKLVAEVIKQEAIEKSYEIKSRPVRSLMEGTEENAVSEDIYQQLDKAQIRVDKAREAQDNLMKSLNDLIKAFTFSNSEDYKDSDSEVTLKNKEKLAEKIENMNKVMAKSITKLKNIADNVTQRTVDIADVLKKAEKKVKKTRKLLAKATEEKEKLWKEVQAAEEEAYEAGQNLVRVETRAAKTGQSKDDSNEVKLAAIAKERADQTLAKLEKAYDDAVEQFQNADVSNQAAEYRLVNAKTVALKK
ncbi:hypothetical protein [Paenibacillus popilliae]|uniref:Uncharacterized protein conserved in bacteria n=1 Tax=Paenibacillus popilliae ATCC 14706 TaxID=1212764 RepID=M9LGQ6_PAEPP|nr:hypothetical protein [Paenibacillus popilliae]GAC41790.1 uncharacterized protein conserved in bacteria [Paenibacillus popilliae ATCC 14706]